MFIRWQIRLAKAAGLSGAFVDLFFVYDINSPALGEFHPEWLDIFGRKENNALDIAQAEGFKLAILDEVAFFPPAQIRATMTQRAIDALNEFGNHPAYLKINNQPVYVFNFYGKYWSFSDLNQFFADVEASVGNVYWIIQLNDDSAALNIAEIDAIQHNVWPPERSGNTGVINWGSYSSETGSFINSVHAKGKDAGITVYPGFDERKLNRESQRFVYRNGGNTLNNMLLTARYSDADFIVISSFNDWQENSNITPGWEFDDTGFTGDPYQYLKIILTFVSPRASFSAPPLPPSVSQHGSIDPLIWGKLYGIDTAGYSNNI